MFALYCKSYRDDVLRLEKLLSSIKKFNCDNIKFYISTPQADKRIFIDTLGSDGYEWLSDESICLSNPKASIKLLNQLPGKISQQIIKSEFWRLNLCDNYLCLDSDSQFIKNFYLMDFFDKNGNLYTIRHDAADFIMDMKNNKMERYNRHFFHDNEIFKNKFNRVGHDYDFGPSPMLWSAEIWRYLSDEILKPQNLTLWNLIEQFPSEIRWYGEAALANKKKVLTPIKPLFKCYHYKWQYKNDVANGIGVEQLKNNYLGIVYQSNWNAVSNVNMKSLLSQLKNNAKNFFINKK